MMRANIVLYGIVAFAALAVIAAPIVQERDLNVRLSLGSFGKSSSVKSGSTKSSSSSSTKSSSSSSGGGLLNKVKGLFGFGSKTTPAAVSTPKATTAAAVKTTPTAAATTAAASKTTAAATTTAATTSSAATSSQTSSTSATSSTSTTSSAEPSETAESCALYLASDAALISARDLGELEKRAGEEFWFRFEDPSITTGQGILTLAARAGGKDFDDQAYKWISTDASKVTRGSIRGRVPTIFVMPAGTRASVLAAAKDFEESRDAQTAQDFVTKDNEPGDVGIQGVKAGADGTTPLDNFRDKVIRVVTVQSNKKNKSFFTVSKGKVSKTASKSDQALLSGFCG